MPHDHDIRLTRDPLDAAAAVARVTCPEAGGIAVFVGTTRAEDGPPTKAGQAPQPLVCLDYHAYEEMALRQLGHLASAAAQLWPICRVVIWHRLGQVSVGDASVLIAVSTPHRAEAFAACGFLIDQLKKTIPIWKHEIYAQSSRWQGA